ncbi:MAG TPA: sigma-70 family RNA polymerase sigma factor [Solirubrobacteraceae bacterium]|nr:sigma-70 family RNA polymerase sigma factor [Solirubrobacteraceae bacterium]
MDSLSDDELLAAAAADGQAFAAFYRRYERPALGYFMRRTRDPELAADLTAELFAAVLLACRRYRPGEGSASAWLFAIAEHKLADARRRGRVQDRARRRLGMAPLQLDDADLHRIESCGEAEQLLDSLPAAQREAVRARILEDRGYDEIAATMRCSPAVVRKRVSRGLAAMREQLSEEGSRR